MSDHPTFSILYGVSCIYLGFASFLFHASHSEVWRKADAGMTSGVAVVPFVFAIFDRINPPSLSSFIMSFLAILFQMSLTHGYLPYGSSDILLPSLLGGMFFMEFSPFYGGAVQAIQYKYWIQCVFGAIGGVLLRAADIKRKNNTVFTNLLRIYTLVTLAFGVSLLYVDFGSGPGYIYISSYFDIYLMVAVGSGVAVYFYPEKGHVCWYVVCGNAATKNITV
jgi:hypothetical protein